MQVSCGQCGMRYEFDAAEIPAEGYDAQCSNCNNVFFVAPEAPAPSASQSFVQTQLDSQVEPRVSVQVAIACPQCSAVYQFDSLDVPEAGYDAQCTQCEAIFLVAPHTVSPYEAAPQPTPGPDDETSFASVNEMLGQVETTTVASLPVGLEQADTTVVAKAPFEPAAEAVAQSDANKSGFLPQLLDGGTFERTDPTLRVPEEFAGHVAQQPETTIVAEPPETDSSLEPTQTRIQTPSFEQQARAHFQAENKQQPEGEEQVLDSGDEHEAQASGSEAQEHAAEPEPIAPIAPWTSPVEQDERLTADPTPYPGNNVLQGPGSNQNERLPTGVLPPDDSGESQRLRTAPMSDISAARRARRDHAPTHSSPGRAVRIAVLVLCVLLGGLYFLSQAKPELVSQILGSGASSHQVNNDALALFDQGQKSLLRDTDGDYEAAIDTFGKALQQEAQYPEAQAAQVVAHSLRGADLRREGVRMYAEWEQEQATWRGLKALERQGTALSAEQASQSQQLEEGGPKHLQAATDMIERGGKELQVAQIQAQRARSLFPRSAPVAAAAALCYTQIPNDMPVAQSLLGQYAGLVGGDADPNGKVVSPNDIWVVLAQGRAAATQEKTRDEARAAFMRALQLEPNLVRARWELAQLDVEAGQLDDAKKRYREILAAVPNHAKSAAALAALEHPVPTQSSIPQPSGSPEPQAPDQDAQAPGAPADGQDAQTPAAKRWRHRRRPAPPPAAAPEEDTQNPDEAPAPPDAPAAPAPQDG